MPPLRSRARPPRRGAGMELQGREILCRPHFVRSIWPGSLCGAQRRRDAAETAAGSGRHADRRRPRRAQGQQGVSRVSQRRAAFAAAAAAAQRAGGNERARARPSRSARRVLRRGNVKYGSVEPLSIRRTRLRFRDTEIVYSRANATSAVVKVCGCRPHEGGAARTGPAYANLQRRKPREVWRDGASDEGIWRL